MANILNFYRGDTQIYKLYFKDANGNPLDLTGSAVWFTMKLNQDDPDSQAKIQIKVTQHTDPENGITTVIVPSSYTDSLTPNCTYYYDFQFVSADGFIKTILSGKVRVLPDITRRTQ